MAIGSGAMALGTTGSYNTAIGSTAMAFANGSDKVAVGDGALNQSSGDENIGIGQYAGQSISTGGNNIVLGLSAGHNITTGSNNIEIANQGGKKDSGFIRIGDAAAQKKTFIAGISGVTVASGVGVVIASNGQLGVVTSSSRYKEAIEPMAQSSEALLSLKPVTFRYKKKLDPTAIPQFGLVAEQVAKVDPDLVARDETGKPYTVRYEAVNAMLLNEFLKEHQTVKAQSAIIEDLKRALAEQQAQIKALTEGLQKLSAQVQTKQDAPRLVLTGD
ncbi:MAG TPA: tail fiber domain-containing protein [Verrucomicrobiae bacterium]|nr:tail fiber domain-containing protein [Verrucomicrobiae bacterium]